MNECSAGAHAQEGPHCTQATEALSCCSAARQAGFNDWQLDDLPDGESYSIMSLKPDQRQGEPSSAK